jgi:hypothetical protein
MVDGYLTIRSPIMAQPPLLLQYEHYTPPGSIAFHIRAAIMTTVTSNR